MDMTTLRTKNMKDLEQLLREAQEELRVLRFKASENQLKDVRAIRETRQRIAQIKTLMSGMQAAAPQALPSNIN